VRRRHPARPVPGKGADGSSIVPGPADADESVHRVHLVGYIHRAMPWIAPKSLKPDEVHALTAFLLSLGGVLSDNSPSAIATSPKRRS
jgi:hypothetical protein